MKIGKWFAARLTREAESVGNEFVVFSIRGNGSPLHYDTALVHLTLPVWTSKPWYDARNRVVREGRRFLTWMLWIRRSWRTHNWSIHFDTMYMPRED